MKTYMFMYLLVEDIDTVKKNLGPHVAYWKSMTFDHFQNGPFADKSGGMIIFSADSPEQAEKLVSQDPLLQEQAIENYWLREWVT